VLFRLARDDRPHVGRQPLRPSVVEVLLLHWKHCSDVGAGRPERAHPQVDVGDGRVEERVGLGGRQADIAEVRDEVGGACPMCTKSGR
jgi:hypothetical protein